MKGNSRNTNEFKPSLPDSITQGNRCFTTVQWVCEVCGLRSFKTLRECRDHEDICMGGGNSSSESNQNSNYEETLNLRKRTLTPSEYDQTPPLTATSLFSNHSNNINVPVNPNGHQSVLLNEGGGGGEFSATKRLRQTNNMNSFGTLTDVQQINSVENSSTNPVKNLSFSSLGSHPSHQSNAVLRQTNNMNSFGTLTDVQQINTVENSSTYPVKNLSFPSSSSRSHPSHQSNAVLAKSIVIPDTSVLQYLNQQSQISREMISSAENLHMSFLSSKKEQLSCNTNNDEQQKNMRNSLYSTDEYRTLEAIPKNIENNFSSLSRNENSDKGKDNEDEESVEQEKVCKLMHHQETNENENPDSNNAEWGCDFCEATFATYDMALEHEKVCKFRQYRES